MLEHTHAIILIKNKKDEYLQYYDKRWDSFLFLNCKLTDDNHIEIISDFLMQSLDLKPDNNQIIYAMDKVHEKYSESAQKIKQYHHYFYVIENFELPNDYQYDNFKVNNIDYTWLSLAKLENNERIQKVNKDIVDFVKQIH